MVGQVGAQETRNLRFCCYAHMMRGTSFALRRRLGAVFALTSLFSAGPGTAPQAAAPVDVWLSIATARSLNSDTVSMLQIVK